MPKRNNSEDNKRKTRETLASEHAVLQALKKAAGQHISVKQIAKHLGLRGKGHLDDIYSILLELTERQKIEHSGKSLFRLKLKSHAYPGVYEWSRDGYGFVFVDELGKEIRVVEIEGETPFPGDKVKILLFNSGKKLLKGKIIEIAERKRKRFAGDLVNIHGNNAFFTPQNTRIKTDFFIPGRFLNKARAGDKVIVELLNWKGEKPEGKIVEVLGASGEHKAEMNAIMMEFDLPEAFDPEIEDFARRIPAEIPQAEIEKRRDFRDVTTFTIDPFDAKDFDDAISFRKLSSDRYEIGVHIADVTYYLPENSILDEEAFERATSVYLVDRVVPMLPERLSNNLCSLVPNEDRLTFSAVFQMDAEGKVMKEWFGRSIIHSDRRFSYEEAQEAMDTGDGDYAEEIIFLNQLAYKLREQRFREGSIDFDTDEVKFRLDEDGVPVEVVPKVRQDAHKLIEDFMLLANKRVAKFVSDRLMKQKNAAFVYRVHPSPDEEKIDALQGQLEKFGYKIKRTDANALSTSINQLVQDIQDRPEKHIIQSLAIRSMPKAIYTIKNIGHYGLGFKHYAHFTSPIRRYPDVLVHRVLDHILQGKYNAYAPEKLESMCKHCSENEKNAADAERASIKYKQVEYLAALVGREFEGVIGSIQDWGIYIELVDSKCEGMAPLRDMKDDHYVLDEAKFKVTGKRTGKTYKLGDRVLIRIKKTDLMKRNIDFQILRKVKEPAPTH